MSSPSVAALRDGGGGEVVTKESRRWRRDCVFGGGSGCDDDDDAAAATAAHLVLHVEAQPPPLAAVLLSRGTADASAQETEERGRVARYGLLRAGLISHWSAATAAALIARAEATRRVTQVPMGAALGGAEAPPPQAHRRGQGGGCRGWNTASWLKRV
jgi:hypothetical protein